MQENRNTWLRNLPILVATLLVIAAGLVQGFWTNRWVTSHELEAAAERLQRVPKQVGSWEGQDQEFETKDYARAGIVGGLLRRYQNRDTGSVVSVLLVCGRPGPISVHTPDVCYRGAGYDQIDDQTQATVESDAPEPAHFWWLRMRKQNTVIPEFLGIHYGWSATGDWSAPKGSPRFEFARFPYLYKLYVVREISTPEGKAESEEDRAFLQAFLPELRKSLFNQTAPAAS